MLLSSIAAPVAFLLLTYWMDHKQPDPLSQLMKGFALGGVVALLSLAFTALLNEIGLLEVSNISSWNHAKQALLGAALPEELSKLIMLSILVKSNKYFDEFLDGVVYAVFIAMGFAAVENVCYLLTNPANWSAVIVGRTILSVPAHFCYAAVMGACFSLWYFRTQKSFLYLAAIAPIVLHAIFDFCLYEVTPYTSRSYLIGIAVVFVILFTVMGCFAYWGIVAMKSEDDVISETIRQKLWKLTVPRRYVMIGAVSSLALLLNGEPVKTDETTPNYRLSPELTEFRDAFCLKIRNAYTAFDEEQDSESLRMELLKALGHYDNRNFVAKQEFAMQDYAVKMADFAELQVREDSVFRAMEGHFCYEPARVRVIADNLYEMPVEDSDMMYEIIHTINKWSTDGSATAVKLPLCKCLHRTIANHAEALFSFSCFGSQELLLVSEHGGNLALELTDLTRNQQFRAATKEGAAWVAWNMSIHGECQVRITNPTDTDLSFVLVSTEKPQ